MWEATEPQGQVIQEAVDAYTEQTGVKVDLQFKGRTGNREALQPALDGGTQIDILSSFFSLFSLFALLLNFNNYFFW